MLFRRQCRGLFHSRNRVSSDPPDEGSKTANDFRRFECVAIPQSACCLFLLRPPPKQRTACCEAVRSRLVREHVPGRGRVEPCAVATYCADLTARANSATSPAGAGARCIAPHFRLPGGRRAVQQNSVCCLRMRPASDNSPVCRAWSPACVAWRLCTLAPDFPGPDPCSPGGGQRMCPSSVSHGASSSYLPPGRASGVYGDWGHSC